MDYEEQQFECEMSSEERSIEGILSDALAVQSPKGLADRVVLASTEQLFESSIVSMEQHLDLSFKITSPEGLASRVYDASVSHIHEVQPKVVARIGQITAWRQLALAACVVFAVLVAVRFGTHRVERSAEQPLIASSAVLSVEDEELLLEDLNLSEFAYLADTREIVFADVAVGLNDIRNDIELWQYGLLSE
jgi:hypothetical protein